VDRNFLQKRRSVPIVEHLPLLPIPTQDHRPLILLLSHIPLVPQQSHQHPMSLQLQHRQPIFHRRHHQRHLLRILTHHHSFLLVSRIHLLPFPSFPAHQTLTVRRHPLLSFPRNPAHHLSLGLPLPARKHKSNHDAFGQVSLS
jgi:hypothetical protein